MEHEKIVLVGVTDIFFYTKIRDAFKPAGYRIRSSKRQRPMHRLPLC